MREDFVLTAAHCETRGYEFSVCFNRQHLQNSQKTPLSVFLNIIIGFFVMEEKLLTLDS